ncbi:MAG TPA: NusG domain II-containing protein [Deltaproteobacteria bacterium]|nr:NusG domain II-containing protein [Deltaproteobacteria bacterium]
MVKVAVDLNSDDNAGITDAMIGRIKITPADIILILSLLAMAVLWFVMVFLNGEPGAFVEVHNEQGPYKVYRLDHDLVISVPGPVGESIVKIQSNEVYMESSPCPNKVCIHTGKIKYAGESIVCIPNKVYIFIRAGKDEVDAVTY